MTLYNFKKINGKKKIIWIPNRGRGLREAKNRIGDLEKEVKQLLKKKRKIKVLDIGTGYGKILLELKKIFGNKVETYGINLEPRWNLKLIRKFAISNNLFSKKEANKIVPKVYIADAGKRMPLKSSSFDLIFALASVQYIPDKARFLEEVNRLLTKEGKAVIELQERKSKHPIEYRSLFEIWDAGKEINLIKYLKQYKGIKIKKSPREWHVLIMKKSKNFRFNLELINFINLNKICKSWWGTKSVYRMKD
ncbi:hypothetical protein CMI42_00635 [Candidatus Pacearchaeota archaeon]|jgi:ubiquinone/menaquinone biosynthesis C-methylase UbiE|nr:hypothetical protein [Candidatus Pacearchaeota archaeon]